jgi:3-oxo-5-alpha-steroid 4-dehydrogenase 1
MEIVSPLTFVATFVAAPLSPTQNRSIPWTHPSVLLAAMFIIHYLNRALISPLRTPSRSRSHIIVNILGAAFNLANGFSMAAYLSSPPAQSFLADAYTRTLFVVGVGIWAAGLVGNILHDEILLAIRRKAVAKRDKNQGKNAEYYGIPQGMLYNFISYPNYLCEWIEWTGFALAAAPLPTSIFSQVLSLTFLESLSRMSVPKTLTPPWIFVITEVLVMLPRAYRGHQWYLNRFPEYPPNRKVVVPFIF